MLFSFDHLVFESGFGFGIYMYICSNLDLKMKDNTLRKRLDFFVFCFF